MQIRTRVVIGQMSNSPEFGLVSSHLELKNIKLKTKIYLKKVRI